MAPVLAVDLGKTGCRAALWDGDARRNAEGPGAPGLAFEGGVEAAEAAILAVASALDLAPDGHACVGAAGALSAPAAAAALATCLLRSLPARHVAVASDAVTAHAGALAGGPGIVLAVGTGTVALAAGPGGTFHRVDGHGPWLGDEGSGAFVGLAGLRTVLRAADGRGPPTTLTEAAARCYGVVAADLPGHLGNTADTARQAARFARFVVEAAENGDEPAGDVVNKAVRSLAATVRAAASRSGLPKPARLVLSGGLMHAGASFATLVRRAVEEVAVEEEVAEIEVVPASGTALDGARLLATDRTTIHEANLVRHPDR